MLVYAMHMLPIPVVNEPQNHITVHVLTGYKILAEVYYNTHTFHTGVILIAMYTCMERGM